MSTIPAVQCPRCRTWHLDDTGCPVCTPQPVRYMTATACAGAVRGAAGDCGASGDGGDGVWSSKTVGEPEG